MGVGRGPVVVGGATLVAPAQIWQASATPKQSTQYGLAGAPRNIAAVAGCGCPAAAQGHGAVVRSQDSSPASTCGLSRAHRAQCCPAASLWLHCASHNRAISLGQHKHDYQAGADLFIPANNAGHICDQVRPLSATCGTREIASSGSPKCRAGARSVQKPGTQRKQPGCLRSLPRHDPGHRNGGTALYACHRLQSQ